MSVTLGFHCSHEQLAPSILLEHAKLAAEAGFAAAMCSDHFRPWSERQGQSGFAWSWLGAALQATPMSFGTVCAPGQRYHPAVIAQAAATLAEMYPERFWLAVGSGEAVNESITGGAWPAKAARNERLQACAEVMRALWSGETVTLRTPVVVDGARLYSRPARPPMLLAAALSAETARWAASWADGLITVAGPHEDMRRVVDAFRDAGGARKPIFLQVALSFAPTDREAELWAHDQWRHSTLEPALLADLDTPEAFDRRSEHAKPGDVMRRVRTSCDIGRHLEWIDADSTLGYDRIYLHNVARDHQRGFIEACAAELIPALCATS